MKNLHRSDPNDVPFSIRMSIDLKQILQQVSNLAGRSVNREMVHRIVHSLLTHPEELTTSELDELIGKVVKNG